MGSIGSVNWSGERLSASTRSSGHALASLQAVRKSFRVRDEINPASLRSEEYIGSNIPQGWMLPPCQYLKPHQFTSIIP